MMHQVLAGRIVLMGGARVSHIICFALGVKAVPAANQAK